MRAQATPHAVDDPPGERRRWCVSALSVVAIHAGAALWLLRANALPAAPPIAPAAPLLVELAPPEPAPAPPPLPEPAPKRTPSSPKPIARPVTQAAVAQPPREAPTETIETAAPTPPADATPTAPEVEREPAPPNVSADWQNRLLAHLQQHQRYPQRARSNRQQGVTYLRLSVGRNGELIASRIERGSGVAVLDEEALATVQRALPLPPPTDAERVPVELIVPMQFIYQRR